MSDLEHKLELISLVIELISTYHLYIQKTNFYGAVGMFYQKYHGITQLLPYQKRG